MTQSLATVALLVKDYDEAIIFFRDCLGFALAEDSLLGEGKRWVVLEPGSSGARLLLAKADGADQARCIGNQGGGRVMFFLETDDFATQHQRMLDHGVSFLEPPRREPYGTVAVFVDLYGNKWDLIEPRR